LNSATKDNEKVLIAGLVGITVLAAGSLAFGSPAPGEPPLPPEGAAPEGTFAAVDTITWWDGESWRPIADAVYTGQQVTFRFMVSNSGQGVGLFRVGYEYYSDFAGGWVWSYSPDLFSIGAGEEGYIFWNLNTSIDAGAYEMTFYLLGNDFLLDLVAATITTQKSATRVEYEQAAIAQAAITEQLYYMGGVAYGYYPPNENYVRLFPVYNFPIDWYHKTYNEMEAEEQQAFNERMAQLEVEEASYQGIIDAYWESLKNTVFDFSQYIA